ncbi:M15 family metallopeptidase [Pontibacter sp. JAM-7]|uniref:M15 family metallopeptidase n=1 Tax=Pontibacter sp. JAM-7 TaxID=3366581 RepID=UPI003AF4FCEB
MSKYILSELFVELKSLIPTLVVDLKYSSEDNFIGEPIEGYAANHAWLTPPAAEALLQVQKALLLSGLGLKVFDAYRPQRAVSHFLRWAKSAPVACQAEQYYPGLQPAELFSEGYLMARSSHSRGSTVDLTIVDMASGAELDMGSPFDFFGRRSWIDCADISAQARANRLLLRSMMEQHGFVPFHHEWWHFTLADEPYPETYFDIPIV